MARAVRGQVAMLSVRDACGSTDRRVVLGSARAADRGGCTHRGQLLEPRVEVLGAHQAYLVHILVVGFPWRQERDSIGEHAHNRLDARCRPAVSRNAPPSSTLTPDPDGELTRLRRALRIRDDALPRAVWLRDRRRHRKACSGRAHGSERLGWWLARLRIFGVSA